MWSGHRVVRALLPQLPHRAGAVSRRWIAWTACGWVLVLLTGIVGLASASRVAAFASLPGWVVLMAGSVLLVCDHVGMRGVARQRALVGIGIAAGVLGTGIAIGLEIAITHATNWRFVLWCAGPVEESAKLLVPVILLVAGVRFVRDPRAGLLLATVSGATFGALEGWEYMWRTSNSHAALYQAALRPLTELIHPFSTAFVAGVVWLAARRAKRTVTRAGVVALLVAAAAHSLRDGIASFSRRPPSLGTLPPARTLVAALIIASTLLGGLAWAWWVLARNACRELVEPDRAVLLVPRWRPRIKQWGAPEATRAYVDPQREPTTR